MSLAAGNKFYTKKDYPEAIKCYGQVLAADPRNTQALINRAMCYIATSAENRCIEDCTAAISIMTGDSKNNASLSKAHQIRGIALQALRKIPESIQEYETALKLDPKNAGAKKKLAEAKNALSGKPAGSGREKKGGGLMGKLSQGLASVFSGGLGYDEKDSMGDGYDDYFDDFGDFPDMGQRLPDDMMKRHAVHALEFYDDFEDDFDDDDVS